MTGRPPPQAALGLKEINPAQIVKRAGYGLSLPPTLRMKSWKLTASTVKLSTTRSLNSPCFRC